MSLSCIQCAAVASHRCSVCGTAYCGAACQNADWIEHKKGCEILAQILDLIGVKTKRKRDDDNGEEEVKKQKSVFEYNLVAFMLQLIKVQPDLAANFLRNRLPDVQSFVNLVNASSEVKDFANRKGIIAGRFPWLKDHVDDYLIVAPFVLDFWKTIGKIPIVYTDSIGWRKVLEWTIRDAERDYDITEKQWGYTFIKWEKPDDEIVTFIGTDAEMQTPRIPNLQVDSVYGAPTIFITIVSFRKPARIKYRIIRDEDRRLRLAQLVQKHIKLSNTEGRTRLVVKYRIALNPVVELNDQAGFDQKFGYPTIYDMSSDPIPEILKNLKYILQNHMNISSAKLARFQILVEINLID